MILQSITQLDQLLRETPESSSEESPRTDDQASGRAGGLERFSEARVDPLQGLKAYPLHYHLLKGNFAELERLLGAGYDPDSRKKESLFLDKTASEFAIMLYGRSIIFGRRTVHFPLLLLRKSLSVSICRSALSHCLTCNREESNEGG